MQSTMTVKVQVTIPKSVRDLLGLQPGNLVAFERNAQGEIVVRKADGPTESRFARFRGHAGPGMTTDEVMALTRGE